METVRQRKARERRESRARIEAQRQEGMAHMARMTCPRCPGTLTHNNSLAGSWWLQCLSPNSVYPERTGCGWQICFEKD